MSTVVNHDYPGTDDMTVVSPQGDPIEDAQVRIFEFAKYEAGEVDSWVGETTTDVDGKWRDPLILDDGATWVVHFQKESMYGPATVEITT